MSVIDERHSKLGVRRVLTHRGIECRYELCIQPYILVDELHLDCAGEGFLFLIRLDEHVLHLDDEVLDTCLNRSTNCEWFLEFNDQSDDVSPECHQVEIASLVSVNSRGVRIHGLRGCLLSTLYI